MNSLVLVVLKKELIDMFRDRKSLIVGILIPLLLMPILSFFMGNMIKDSTKSVEENCKIAIIDNNNSSLTKFISSDKSIQIENSSDAEQAVKDGKVYLVIKIPDEFDNSLISDKNISVSIEYDNTSQKSSIAFSKLRALIDAFSKQVVAQRLTARNIDVSILTPVNIVEQGFEKENKAESMLLLNMLVPMFILLYSAQGAIAAATDLGAGEKERGTLEPLLTTKAGRKYILSGKLLAITLMGFIVSLSSMAGMIIAMVMPNGMFSNGNASVSLSYLAIILMGIISLLNTMFFGAAELAISIYARSFKEAQTYLIPFSIIPIFVAYGSMTIEAKNASIMYFNIPLVNVAVSVKELISGIYNYTHLGLTIGWSIIYAVLALTLARYMFNKEEVIFRS